MALSGAQRAMIAKAIAGRDNSGGEAYRQWQDDPGANWAPPSRNGAVQAHPIPNAGKARIKPIPSSGPSTKGLGKRGRRRYT